MSLVILGIDPGLANTGWAVVECEGSRYRGRACGCISTGRDRTTPQRLRAIYDDLCEVIARESPDECAIEDVYFSVNAKTAFDTGQARGVAMLATSCAGIPVGEYGPSEVKLAVTGSGSADKRQVAYMVRTILGLSEAPSPHHVADAFALAICHANGRGLRGLETRIREEAAG